ncbi:Nucleoside-diphosphate-sugar epimerase [Sphingobium sp. YR657]|uniref:NAD-dependent epimerase/dehydratase family protein n=1 Tax=Sphingobium sp. YR657 TaxID=1884366 RepID=UPI0009133BA3|nr:NAD-dependent epimerase/dehydratase family protein [Sphingobium sp. YR657]SHM45720.1 Nucleoside-diphosphate-sugar epimerase [Sphingobium sp. YR657]
MSRVIVIGGSGHVGTYLVPALVELGHEVVNVSRGQAKSYTHHAAWKHVEQVSADRTAEEEAGTFAERIVGLRGDIVIDLIAFKLSSTRPLVEALRGKVEHFLHCSTLWVYGHNAAVPAGEDDPLNPFGEYGIDKAEIEKWLTHEARTTGFPATIFRPGHIVGEGWVPISPLANDKIDAFSRVARGEKITLPNLGLETIHHVHAADVSQVILRAITNRSAAIGETFNAVSGKALNLRGYAEALFRWFGHEPKIDYLPADEWKKWQPTPEEAHHSWEHFSRSSCLSIEKARTKLGYEPAYTSFGAVQESVAWLIDNGKVEKPTAWE